jgi:hypothetical protein
MENVSVGFVSQNTSVKVNVRGCSCCQIFRGEVAIWFWSDAFHCVCVSGSQRTVSILTMNAIGFITTGACNWRRRVSAVLLGHFQAWKFFRMYVLRSGPGSSVCIATDYGLDGPGIESRWGRDFSHTSRPAYQASCYNGYRVFPGGKAVGAWCWPPTPS